jgi:integrase
MVNGTRRDAELTLAKLKLSGSERRLHQTATNARTIRHVFDLYIDEAKDGRIQVSPKTVVTSRSAANTMCRMRLPNGKRFGDQLLSRVRWSDIENVYAAMAEMGLSVAWVRRSATVLSCALDRAVKHGLMEYNPSKGADGPKLVRRKPFSPLTTAVDALLVSVSDGDPELGDFGVVMANTGMRPSELLALTWSELDVVNREIHVAWAIVDGGTGVGILRAPTKGSDWRDVPLTNAALEAFARQRARRESFVGAVQSSWYIFPGQRGDSTPLRYDRLAERWLAQRGDSPITLMGFRHFVATTMLDAGVPYRTVADLLGNSEVTLRLHYDGRTDVGKRDAISMLERR